MFSINESVQFLLVIRSLMSETTSLSELSKEEKVSLQNYFTNQATDYEIMHLFVKGDIPKNRYDIVEEANLFDEFRSTLKKDLPILSKYVDKKIIESVILKVGPVSDRGLSSSHSVLEFLITNSNTSILLEDKVDRWKLRDIGKGKELAKKQIKSVTMLPTKANFQRAINFFKTSKKGQVVAAAAVVALAVFAGYKLYQAKFSAAAKACIKLQGPEKSACMKKFKLAAMNDQLAALKQGITACPSSSNPEQCSKTLQNKIRKLEIKMKSLK
jgi:hypothetical protein